jgi:cobalt-zinc-cadmium efflux system membrane fusion protein
MIRGAAKVLCALPLILTACHRQAATIEGPFRPASEVWLTQKQLDDAQIDVQSLDSGVLTDSVTAAGKIAFDDINLWHGFSPVSGRVTKLLAVVGQHVNKGDALAAIESPDVAQATADMAKANADVVAGKHDYERAKSLWDQKAISMHDLEASEDNYLKAKSELERAQQKVVLLRGASYDTMSQSFVLKSGVDGEVLARNVTLNFEIGGLYGGGTPVELFTIGELDHVWVLADIYEADIARVHPGAAATVLSVSFPDRVYDTKVEWISSTLDPISRTAKIRCELANPDHSLRPDMFATVRVHVEALPGYGVNPDAVVRLGQQTMVFLDEGESPTHLRRFRAYPVLADEGDGDKLVRILSGPPKGSKVVVKNAKRLSSYL